MKQKTSIAVACLFALLLQSASAYASSWNPGLLVNTETFQVIDDTDTASDLYVRFGDALNKRLTFERTLDRFNFNDDVYVSGDLNVKGTASGKTIYATDSLRSSGALIVDGTGLFKGTVKALQIFSGAMLSIMDPTNTNTILGNLSIGSAFGSERLEVIGTASGRTLYASDSLRSSGTLVWEGAASGASLWVSTFKGAGLTSCNADGETLGWNSATQQFECGDDDTGAGGSTAPAQGLTAPAAGFLALSTSFSGTSLEIIGTASGRTIFANDTLASSGNLIVESLWKHGSGAIAAIPAEYQTGAYLYGSGAAALALDAYTQEQTHGMNLAPHILFGYKGVFDTNLFRSASATLKTIGAFHVVGTASGRILHAQDELRSSGSLLVEGTSMLQGTVTVQHNTPNATALKLVGSGSFTLLAASGGSIIHTARGNPTRAGTYNTTGAAKGVTIAGRYTYVADQTSGLHIIDVSNPATPTLVNTLNTSGNAYGVAIAGRYAYVADDASGLQIIDVSNPASPTLVGTYDTSGNAYGVAIAGHYAYVADRLSGLQIIDVSNPATPTLVGTYDTTGDAWHVAIAGRYVYVADDTSGLQIIDVSNPASPTLVGTYNTSSVAFAVAVAGRYAYVADGADGLDIIDISNPASPTLVGTYDTSGAALAIAVAGRYAYVADQASGLQVIDVSNPASPTLVGTYDTDSDVSNIANGVVIAGRYAYLTENAAGLQVIAIQGIESPTAAIGAVEAGTLSIRSDGRINGNLTVDRGLNVGDGIYVFGQTAMRAFSGSALTLSTQDRSGKAALTVLGTASGRLIHAQDKLTSSGGATIDGGHLIVGAQVDATAHTFTNPCNCLTNSAAGTFGADTARDAVVSSVIYKGKIFISTRETDAGGVYRYDGGTTWTLVTNAVGKAVSGDTANIDSYVLGVFNGALYIGSQGTASTAGLYSSTTAHTTTDSFTLVNSARGSFGMSVTVIDGISDMTVWNGNLIISTQEANVWELGRYDGGTTFVQINATDGKIVAEATADADGAVLAVYGGRLFVGVQTASTTARIGVHDGVGTTLVSINATAGTFGADASTVDVTSLAVHNGMLYVGTSKASAGAVYRWLVTPISSSTTVTNFNLVNVGVGEMTSGDTVNLVDSVIIRTYNGRLYAGTRTGADGTAAIYEYDDTKGNWTIINGTRGTFGAQTGVNDVGSLQTLNGNFYVGTDEANVGSLYSWTKTSQNSFSLKFDSGFSNLGSINFVGDTNAVDTHDQYGTFRFSHGVALSTGAFDYAEDYPTSDTSLEAGDIVGVAEQGDGYVNRATMGRSAIGVISKDPGFRLEPTAEQRTESHYVPVALVGRVPVKVTALGGTIRPGDSLTISPQPGIAMKATSPGQIIGRAMASFDGPGVGTVLVFINVTYEAPDTSSESLLHEVKTLQGKVEGLMRRLRE